MNAHLKLNPGLGDVLLAATAACDLLSLGDLVSDGLYFLSASGLLQHFPAYAYLSAEVLEGEALNSVDAELGAGLDGSETTRDCCSMCQPYSCIQNPSISCIFHACSPRSVKWDVRKNCLLPADSSITSTRPGLSCSMEGTWLARTPMSPVSAGMLT